MICDSYFDCCQPFNQGYGGSFELATRIAKKTPEGINRIFYTICGSTAVETAIKIAIAYHRAKVTRKDLDLLVEKEGTME